MFKKPLANSVDPDQTAPIEAVYSGSMLFASILNSSVILGFFFFEADDFSRRLQQMTFSDYFFFLGALRANTGNVKILLVFVKIVSILTLGI